MRIKLEEKEIQDASRIVKVYTDANVEIQEVEDELKNLELKKTEILQRVDDARSEEEDFFKALREKYGEGKIDLASLEYVVEK